MQIKTLPRYHFSPTISSPIMLVKHTISSPIMLVKMKKEDSTLLMRMQTGSAPLEGNLAFRRTLHLQSFDLAPLLLGIYSTSCLRQYENMQALVIHFSVACDHIILETV